MVKFTTEANKWFSAEEFRPDCDLTVYVCNTRHSMDPRYPTQVYQARYSANRGLFYVCATGFGSASYPGEVTHWINIEGPRATSADTDDFFRINNRKGHLISQINNLVKSGATNHLEGCEPIHCCHKSSLESCYSGVTCPDKMKWECADGCEYAGL